MTKEIQTTSPTSIGIFQGSRSLIFNNLTEIHKFATMVCKTDLAPKAYRGKAEDATVAIIYGMEIGLPPMASLQNIAVVNGTPSVYGDGQLSLVQSSGKYEWHKSSYKGTFPNDDFTAIFEVKRLGMENSVVKEYSVADAKRAQLWGKTGTWTTSPKLMMLYKAKSYALREAFADKLKGMKSSEEMEGELIDVSPSKTRILHEPPTELREVFNPIIKVESHSEEITEQLDLENIIEELSEPQLEDNSMSDCFDNLKNGLSMLHNKRALNMFISNNAHVISKISEEYKSELSKLIDEKSKSFKE